MQAALQKATDGFMTMVVTVSSKWVNIIKGVYKLEGDIHGKTCTNWFHCTLAILVVTFPVCSRPYHTICLALLLSMGVFLHVNTWITRRM